MSFGPWSRLWRYRAMLLEGALLLALMTAATLIAFEFDIFPNPPGVPLQDKVIELDEALALASLFVWVF